MILGYILPDKERYSIMGEYKGNFKLEKNEKVLMKMKNVWINFAKYRWDREFNISISLDEGYGTLYKTNKRLMYIRNINPHSSNRFWIFGPIAFIEEGDTIEIDIEKNKINPTLVFSLI